jgi:hypothetical protein
VVVVAAGVTGAVLLAFPGSTDRYFSWTLRPPPAAALIGGFYVGSAVVFALALTMTWAQVRVLLVGALGLAVPTLVLTLVHDEVFDFGRWQAVAWVALFVTAPLAATAILLTHEHQPEAAGARRLRPWSRAVLAVLAVGLLTVAVLVWFDATRDDVDRWSPVALVRLTGTYLGAWCSFLAVLCAWAAARDRGADARLPLTALAAAATGTLVALLRTLGDLRHGAAAVAVAVALLALAVALYAGNRPAASDR